MLTNFEGKQFLDAAEQILRIENLTEELVRTSVGRFYYAAFLEARESARITNNSGSVHEDVIRYYSSRNPTLSNRLVSLKRKRAKADYDLSDSVTERDARDAKRLAYKIVSSLNERPKR